MARASSEEKVAVLTKALTCPECGKLMAITRNGVICLEGHGRIYRFGELAEKFNLTEHVNGKRLERIDDVQDPLGKQRDTSAQVRSMLIRRFPKQVVK